MKTAAVLCARMSSTRLPGKVMADLCGKPVLERNIDRLKLSKHISQIIVATSTSDEDDIICSLAAELGIPCYRGSLNNVSERMEGAIKRYAHDADYIFRAMSDQPFFDWTIFDEAMGLVKKYKWDFILPLAFDVEPLYGICCGGWSRRAWQWDVSTSKNDEKEHPGMRIRKSLNRFDYGLLDLPKWAYRGHRLELDTPEDLSLFRLIYNTYDGEPPMRWVTAYLDRNRQISSLNAGVEEKTGTFTSYTAAEIAQWQKDYVNRPVIWSDLSFLASQITSEVGAFRCEDCGNILLAERIRKGNLVMKCAGCGQKRTFYAKRDDAK